MGRPLTGKESVIKKGQWRPEEDLVLASYIQENGSCNWQNVPKNTGLERSGKSCRLRWVNHLKPGLKKYSFTVEEDRTIIHLQAVLGNKWAAIANHLPGRNDNDIKNYWNTHLKKIAETTQDNYSDKHQHGSSSSVTTSARDQAPSHTTNHDQFRSQAAPVTPTLSYPQEPYVFNCENVAIWLQRWNKRDR